MKSHPTRLLSFLTIIFIAIATSVQAQMPDVKQPVQTAMQNVSVMAGEWEGSNWSMSPDGTRKTAKMRGTAWQT